MILVTENIYSESAEVADAPLSVREVAVLSGTTMTAVNNCVDRVFISYAVGRRPRVRDLDRHAVYFMALKAHLDRAGLSPRVFRELFEAISDTPDERLTSEEIRLSDLLLVDARPIADLVVTTRRYLADRERFIVSDPQIKGGIPVIRGSRLDVYSVQQRMAAGETAESLAREYDGVPAEAFTAAALYARTHPRRGRPPRIGRPAAA